MVAMATMAAEPKLQVEHLRVEYLENPAGIDETAPRLSWKLTAKGRGARQTAYQLLVASSERLLRKNRADLWDSSKVASSETTQIVYRGKALGSREQCFWKVRAYSGSDKASTWSAMARWSMGLLTPKDWTARWI